jgi:hypothetical protein
MRYSPLRGRNVGENGREINPVSLPTRHGRACPGDLADARTAVPAWIGIAGPSPAMTLEVVATRLDLSHGARTAMARGMPA